VLEISATAWAVTLGLIVTLLVTDLALSVRRPHAVGFREAVAQSVFYIGVAIAFGVIFGTIAGWDYGALLRIGTAVQLFRHRDQDPEIATSTSLAVIVIVLTTTTISSLLKVRRDPTARAHAGTLRSRPQEKQPPRG
jgi:hypothetical protein